LSFSVFLFAEFTFMCTSLLLCVQVYFYVYMVCVSGFFCRGGDLAIFCRIVWFGLAIFTNCAVVPTRICLSLSTNILQLLRQRKVIFYLSLRRRNSRFCRNWSLNYSVLVPAPSSMLTHYRRCPLLSLQLSSSSFHSSAVTILTAGESREEKEILVIF
jgi:hypothetical protein